MKQKYLCVWITALMLSACGGGGNDSGTGTSGASGSGSGATGSASANGSASPSQFLNQVTESGANLQQLSQVATQKSSNPEVLVIAREINVYVTNLTQNVTKVSQTQNITVTNVVQQNQAQVNQLNNLSGTQLDAAYLQQLVTQLETLLAQSYGQATQGNADNVQMLSVSNLLQLETLLARAQEQLCLVDPNAWLADAYQDGLLEIQLSQAAQQKATNVQVKAFAQRMVTDHTQANQQIAALATSRNVTLPTGLNVLQQQILAHISSFSGADFDKAYMDRNVVVHQADVTKTTLESEQSTDTAVKSLASQLLPVLQAHLQSALEIDSTLTASDLYTAWQQLCAEAQFANIGSQSTNTSAAALSQQIVQEDTATGVQLLQQARQQKQPLPLAIPPGLVKQVQALQQASGTQADTQVLQLINLNASGATQTSAAASSQSASTLVQTILQLLRAHGQRAAAVTGGGSGATALTTPSPGPVTTTTTGSGTTGSSGAAGTTGPGNGTGAGSTTTGAAAASTT